MALKKHKLDLAMDEDFCLLGLVSDEEDYRLCWIMNRAMHTGFEKLDDLKLPHKKLGKEQFISNFAWTDEGSMLTFRIITNKAEEAYYLDELKNLDYLIHIQGELQENRITNFIREVSLIPEVRLCVPVELKKVKQQDRLLLW